jgi:hypothetical protein
MGKKKDVVEETKKVVGKTETVLLMVEKGKTRKQILDVLCEMNQEVSRKSNAGLVSHIFKTHELLGKVESGVDKTKKVQVVVKKTVVKKNNKKTA